MCQRVRIKLDRMSDREASAVMAALRPDNIDIPEGLSVEMSASGDSLSVDVEDSNIKRLISTTDEILEHIQTAMSVIQNTEGKGCSTQG